MRSIFPAVYLLSAVFVGCTESPCGTTVSHDDQLILQDYFRGCLEEFGPDAVCHILPETTTYGAENLVNEQELLGLETEMPLLKATTIHDFREKNKAAVCVPADVEFPVGVLREMDPRIEERFAEEHYEGAWRLYDEEYPESCGRYRVSRIGHNADDTQALLYVDVYWGHRAYTGWFLLYDRSADSWELVATYRPWFS